MSSSNKEAKIFGRHWSFDELPVLLAIIMLPALLFIREAHPHFWSIEATRIIVIATQLLIISCCLIYTPKVKLSIARPTFFLIATWFIWMTLATLLSTHPWQGAMRLAEIIINVLYAGLLGIYLANKPFSWTLRLTLSLLVTPLLCLAVYLLNWNLLDEPQNYDWVHSPPLFINIRHFGAVLTLIFPIGLWFLIKQKPSIRFIGIAYLSIIWALLFWTGGRGPILAITLTTIAAIAICGGIAVPILLAALIGLFASQWFAVDDPSMSLFRLFNVELANKTLDEISSSRLTIYYESILNWWNNAPLMGLGADAFRYITPPISDPYIHHPHSVAIELLMSFGLPGLLIAVILLVNFAIKFTASFRHKQAQEAPPLTAALTIPLGFAATAGLIHANLSGVLYIPYSGLLFSTLVALCIAHINVSMTTLRTKQQTQDQPVNLLIPSAGLLLIVSCLTGTAFIQHQYSLNTETTEDWFQFNQNYPLYLNLETWLENSRKTGNQQQEKTLLKAGIQLSDQQEMYS